jgi:hypothetical protein
VTVQGRDPYNLLRTAEHLRRAGCVAHTGCNEYCFRTCGEKAECNSKRGADVEANCSSNVEYVEDSTSAKSCVPPSG